MSATVSDLREVDAPPSFEAARKAQQQILLTSDALRLYWTLEGPLSSAIRVMDDRHYDPNTPLAPYCDQTAPSPSWSPVSQSPLTEPKISSVTVHVEQLDDWEELWLDIHRDHAEPGPHNEASDFARFGPLPDYDPDSDEEGPEHLLRCCHQDRPRKTKVSLVVKAAGEFVTVHDYVSVVHPWLMSLRENILQAAGDLEDCVLLPANTRLIVEYAYARPDILYLYEEKEWQDVRLKEGYLKSLEQIRAWKQQKALQDQEAKNSRTL
ncbi:uncharacterized protein BDR25DRAFT_365958 [Lindgomyces ingoldianus]|uniref:Uncharacterized protein n=1 Tax=Lindgomyces ingoldianus TaxID=673940 RepID=A0ACB6R2P3_9PLEO|nr:uncharacterized protein BDR25DRAFT_365958 [Lindgomyces ingoldianus]KAF2472782.1 hypothetical protein BDR25DRAFT_365958 [Lindgomyces ingoldianus]